MQQLILKICVSSIIGSIIFLLVPNSNLKNAMGWIVNLFLMSIILTPLINQFQTLNFKTYFNKFKTNENFLNNINSNQEELSKNRLETAIKLILERNGYIASKINIELNKNPNKTKISIQIPKEKQYSIEKIVDLIKQETGIEPSVCTI